MTRRRTPLIESLEARQLLALFANGIDSENMGKGAWGWDLRNAMIQQGFTYSAANYSAFFTFLKTNLGLDYFITKAADADDVFFNSGGVQNYTTAVKTAAQGAGIKILPYFYIYGGAKVNSTLQGEIDVFKQFMDTNVSGGGANPDYVGGDGAVLDIEGEYAGATGGPAAAIVNYATGIGKSQAGTGAGVRDSFFISYSTFPYVHLHSEVPYLQLGDYFDAVMPQAYWADIAFSPSSSSSRSPTKGQPLTGAGGPTRMVTDVNSEFGQRSLESTPRNNIWFGQPNSIKPIILTGQSYGTATSSEITEFITAAKNSTTVPKTGAAGTVYSHGYRSIDFFDLNSTDSGERTAINGQTVGAAPGTPSSPTPANNATNVAPTGLVLDWADIIDASTTGAATSYDVYFDGAFKANVSTSSWTVSPAITGGSHTWQIVAKNVRGNTSGPTWNFSANIVLPGVPSSPSPANNAVLTVQPTKLDWADSSNATNYDVYIGTSVTPVNVTVSELTINPADGVRLWRVTAKNASGSTDGPQWQYTLDRAGPVPTYGGQTPTNGATYMDFTVTYTDTVTGVDYQSLDSSDITVTGPNSYSAGATLVSVNVLSNGSPRIATYRIPAPGGTWDPVDNGSYTVALNATQVKDVAGNYRTAGTVGSFSAGLANNFAYMSGTTLVVEMDGANPVQLAPSASDIVASRGATTLSFSGATDVSIVGSPGSDTLDYAGTIAVPISYAGGAGGDRLNVLAGTYTFGANANNLSVFVSSGATAVFNAAQDLAALSIASGGMASSSADINSTGSIANAGTLQINNGATFATESSFSNSGTLNVTGGTVLISVPVDQLSAGSLTGGTWNVSNGATLNITTGGSITTNLANVTLSGAASSFNKATDFTSNAGTITLTGGQVLALAGSLDNTGTITIGASSGINVNGNFNQSGTLAAEGAVSVTGGGSFGAGTSWLAGSSFTGGSGTTTFATNVGGNLLVSASSGTLQFNNSQKLGALQLSGTAQAVMAPNGNRFMHIASGGLTISSATAGLNLADNDLIVDGAAFTDVRALVTAGKIFSSTATPSQTLALFDNAFANNTSWMGEPVPTNAIVGKYTYFGDCNLDGQVTGDDYTVIDSNLGTSPAPGVAWTSGDANIDNTVTGDDYTTVDSNLGSGVGNPLSASALRSATSAKKPLQDDASLAEELGL